MECDISNLTEVKYLIGLCEIKKGWSMFKISSYGARDVSLNLTKQEKILMTMGLSSRVYPHFIT